MFSSTQAASPRARLLIARHALKSKPVVSIETVVKPQQARQLSLDRWTHVSSHLHREVRRRHRLFAYKCMDSLHRYLSWDNNPRSENSKVAMRKVMAQWVQSNSKSNNYTNVDEIKSWSDDVSGMRPGRSIEDVEREAINQLFKTHAVWSSPLQAMRDHIHAGRAPREVTAEDVLQATAGRDGMNFIDPITNRRVTRSEHGRYSAADIDNPNAPRKLTPEEQSKLYEDLDEYKPTRWNEPDGLPKLTPEEESKQYTDLNKYTPEIDDPNAPRELTPEEKSKLYEDLDKYDKPVTWNEPDGLQKPTPEEESKKYDDLDKYDGPVQWNEPDGLQKPTPEEQSKDYKDLSKYQAFAWNEPDGLRRLTPEEKSKQYDDLHSYSGPFVAKKSILREYEAILNDPTVKGVPLAAKVEVQSMPTQYEDLHMYGPVMWNEPDGLRMLTPEEKSKQYEDLHNYAQYDNSGPETARVHPEEASKQYTDLPFYSAFDNSGPEIERIHPEEASKAYKDLTGYSAFQNSGPEVERIHPEEASKQYKDLHAYPSSGYEEPDNSRHVHPEVLTKNYSDLNKYEPQSFDSPTSTYPTHPEEMTKDYQDLHRYEKATPFTQEESMESMTANDIRHQVMVRARLDQYEQLDKDSEKEVEMSSMDESFPMETKGVSDEIDEITNKLAKMRAETDPYSHNPQGLEISFSEEGEDSEPALVKHYEGKAAIAEEPLTYKILAYDPATQSINVAETTSADHDSGAPQKLGDVLLKLSHPSKFLPHFKMLQAQGYDIVSGGGDVLIFRKNRPASPDADDYVIAMNTSTPKQEEVQRAVPEEKKKRSLGRKVVMGTVWVGGVAYAVGVLGENLSAGK
ncbi:hypothetical protein PT974_09756 [Cladobotryum mycophilum]|uniref:Uncharacterized protein n=1 Tax=Cladobotryum mycophilum TaxID=491253 RepID=A0ABR0SH47_9HYPO